jgi:hypothetical protein
MRSLNICQTELEITLNKGVKSLIKNEWRIKKFVR